MNRQDWADKELARIMADSLLKRKQQRLKKLSK
jgi:hypothetical protein